MKNFHKLLIAAALLLLSFASFAETEVEKFYQIDMNYNKAIDSINVKFQNPMKDIDENFASFVKLNNIFEQFLAFDTDLGKRLLTKVENGDPLSGDDLYFLKRTIATFYKINKKLLDFGKIYNTGTLANSIAKENTNTDTTPQIKSHLIYLTAHLQVLDHIVKVHDLYYQSSGIFRRITKKALKDKDQNDSKIIKDLVKMSEYIINIGNKKDFANQVILTRNISDDLIKILNNDSDAASLITSILTNQSSIDIARGKKDFTIVHHRLIDEVTEFFSKLSNWLSGFFGNVAGSIRWRKGFMYESQSVLSMMKEKLQPMDVLLEKSPFTLTDKFIPGHYGHVALYLGTKEQLEAINMWNHPDIIPYQQMIEEGNVILEAVRPGVKLSKLEEFINIDEVTVVRKKDALENPDGLIESITRGMDQIGKDYDFNFDVETLDKIVCSELVYIVYGQVKWPTKYRLGRATISPDDVAEVIFQKDTKFNVEQYLIAPERHRIETGSIIALGDELNYELRSEDGSPRKTENDPSNTFWKKEEKCYRVATEEDHEKMNFSLQCKTTYSLVMYAERTVGN
jgi:hypothetical protein